MNEFTFNIFKELFLAENIEIVSIKKTFLKKYLLIRIEFNYPNTDIIYVQKTSEQLKKVYSSVKRIFPNFQVRDKKHRQNLRKIIELTKQEMQKQEHTFLLDSLYGFLFKSKKFDVFDLQKNFEEQNDNSDGSFDDGYLKKLSNKSYENQNKSDQMIAQKIEENNTKQAKELGNKVLNYSRLSLRKSIIKEQISILQNDEFMKDFIMIFKQCKDLGWISYQRMQFYEKKIQSIEINDTEFEVQLQFPSQHQYVDKFIVIKNKAIYIYNNKREYFLDKQSYEELFILIIIDKVSYKFSLDGMVDIILHFNKDSKETFIRISKDYYAQFLIKFLQQILAKKSIYYQQDQLPEPLIHRGNFLLQFERIQTDGIQLAKKSDKIFNLKSNIFNIDLEITDEIQSVILPIVNVFDVIEISHKNKKIFLEIQKVLEFETGKTKNIKILGFFQVKCQPWNQRIFTYCENVLENYHERRKLDYSISSTIDELKICVYRIKRFQAIKWILSYQINDFFNFKYPRFSTILLLISALFLIFFSLLNYIFLLIFLFLTYFHPQLKQTFDSFIERQLINQKLLNKDYIEADYITDKRKRRMFYSKIDNIDNQGELSSNIGLTTKIQNAIEASSYIPQVLHFTIDWIEKIKNIIMWKQKRKTESVLFLLFILVVFLMLISIEHLIVFYIVYLFYRGQKYYKSLRIWNSKVLLFMIDYFLKNIFEYNKVNKENLDEFFENFEDDNECKKKFSKQFCKFISKYLFVTFNNDYWIDKFSKKLIIKKLLHTQERFYFPYYEEKRYYPTLYLIFYFIFSTPSDLYYYEMKKTKNNQQKFFMYFQIALCIIDLFFCILICINFLIVNQKFYFIIYLFIL